MMKSLRHVLMIAVAFAASSAAPAPVEQAKPPAPSNATRQPGGGKVSDTSDPVKKLAEDNARLKTANKNLRDDIEALNQQLEAYQIKLRRLQQNHGAVVVPPQAPQGQSNNTVPRDWRPFEFNGATYYVVPLKAERDDDRTTTNTLMDVVPARPAPAK